MRPSLRAVVEPEAWDVEKRREARGYIRAWPIGPRYVGWPVCGLGAVRGCRSELKHHRRQSDDSLIIGGRVKYYGRQFCGRDSEVFVYLATQTSASTRTTTNRPRRAFSLSQGPLQLYWEAPGVLLGVPHWSHRSHSLAGRVSWVRRIDARRRTRDSILTNTTRHANAKWQLSAKRSSLEQIHSCYRPL